MKKDKKLTMPTINKILSVLAIAAILIRALFPIIAAAEEESNLEICEPPINVASEDVPLIEANLINQKPTDDTLASENNIPAFIRNEEQEPNCANASSSDYDLWRPHQENGADIELQPENKDSATSTEINDLNIASTTNSLVLYGNTGDNEIASSPCDALIDSGDASIIAKIINYINTNIIGEGKNFLINLYKPTDVPIDLSGYHNDDNSASSTMENGQNYYVINNANASDLQNGLNIYANTGNNAIASSSGSGEIKTGNISIINNLFNLENLNITGENWFFAVVNIFDALNNDVILPVMDNGQKNNQIAGGNLSVANSNDANQINAINLDLNTGNNTASGTSAAINTGAANADINDYDLINYNLTGNNWGLMRVNVFGAWDGVVQGLPDNYGYVADDTGFTIYNNLIGINLLNPVYYDINNTNYASTTNNINICADTGNNLINGEGASLISTGDINVKSNLVNFINNNFTGNDWQFGLINVFGDWQGNLAFGRPDLWIIKSVSPRNAGRGDYVTYTFMYGNKGDGKASNVAINDDFDPNLLEIDNAGGGEISGNKIKWLIGDLPPNSQGSLSYSAKIKGGTPDNSVINTTGSITSNEADRDLSNNSAGSSISISSSSSDLGSSNLSGHMSLYANSGEPAPSFSIVKINDAKAAVHVGDKVNYKIIVKNTGSFNAYNVKVKDIMADTSGKNIINNDNWDLDMVEPGEEVVIDYAIEIKDGINSGTYINEAVVAGNNSVEASSSAVASSKIMVENNGGASFSAKPVLEIGKIIANSKIKPGEKMHCQIVITNNFGEIAHGATATSSLPEGLAFDNGSRERIWELGDIAPGEFKNIDYDIIADKLIAAGEYGNNAIVGANNFDAARLVVGLEVAQAQEDKKDVKNNMPAIQKIDNSGNQNKGTVLGVFKNGSDNGGNNLSTGMVAGAADSGNKSSDQPDDSIISAREQTASIGLLEILSLIAFIAILLTAFPKLPVLQRFKKSDLL